MRLPTGPPEDVQASCLAAVVDEWRRAGVCDAVICPGSRSTPLVLALAGSGLALHVRVDERSAGFLALGIGLASGVPAVVCVTSGTAAAELHPAVVEAHHARVPMLVCTADRPPELHGVGATQTIDQAHLYGRAVRGYVDLGVADAAAAGSWRSVASRALLASTASPEGPGPVHLNVACREPLLGRPRSVPPGRPDGAPWHRTPVGLDPAPGATDPHVAAVLARRRGVLVAGAGISDPGPVLALGEMLDWPVLADPRSGCRRPGTVAHADALVRAGGVAARLVPDAVVQVGAPWVSRALAGFLDEAVRGGAPFVVVDGPGTPSDPARAADVLVAGDPAAWCAAVLGTAGGLVTDRTGAAAASWREAWEAADAAAGAALDVWCSGHEDLDEPGVARRLVAWLDPEVALVVASSMPVRDVEWFAPRRDAPPRVLANRGASGIDGVVSTAVGVSLGRGPTVALVGDLAFFHDLTALVGPAGEEVPLTVVAVDNGGGGIFSFLPQARELPRDVFEALFATPPAPDPAAAARGLGVPVREVATATELRAALGDGLASRALNVVVARVPDRRTNQLRHDELQAAMASAAASALGLS